MRKHLNNCLLSQRTIQTPTPERAVEDLYLTGGTNDFLVPRLRNVSTSIVGVETCFQEKR